MAYNPIVSVIIPVYNTEKYLRQCLDSIMSQTFQNFEVICVDDFSNDNSWSLLQEYAENYSNFSCIRNKENMGAAYCRNLGIKMSKGEYLLFLDSDDYFDKEMLEKGVVAIQSTDADMVFWDAIAFDDKTNQSKYIGKIPEYFNQILKMGISPVLLAEYLLDMAPVGPVRKIYRRNTIILNKLEFQSLSNSNDVYFGNMILMLSTKVVYLKENLLHIRKNRQGQISETRGKSPICAYQAMLAVYKHMLKEDIFSIYRKTFYRRTISSMLYVMYALGSNKITIKKFQEFMINQGWKNLGMNDLSREDFVSNWDYIRYKMVVKEKKFKEARDCNIDILFNKELIDSIKPLGKDFCLWGYGKRGQNFWDVARKYKLNISCIVDCKYKSDDRRIDGVKLSSLENQDSDFDTVLITNFSFYDDVRKSLLKNGRRNVKIIDIDTSIQYQIPIEKCVYV